MARNELSLAKILYFCNVKNQLRHDVAARSSVFCVLNLLVNSNRIGGGNSNVPKGSAVDTLTARIGVLLCLKFMETNAKKLQDAQQKVVESIQGYLNDFHSVAELYERTAKAMVEIIRVSNHLSDEAKKLIGDMTDDHLCLLNLLKSLEEKGE